MFGAHIYFILRIESVSMLNDEFASYEIYHTSVMSLVAENQFVTPINLCYRCVKFHFVKNLTEVSILR